MKITDAVQAVAPKKEPEVSEIAGDTWSISLPRTHIHTLDQLLAYCEVDLKTWEVERFIVNKWEVGAKDAASELVIKPLFQVKATLKKRVEIVAIRQEIADLILEAKKKFPPPKPVRHSVRKSGNMLQLNPTDFHFGKLAWPPETGGPPFDLKIAEAMYERSQEVLLDRVKGYSFDQILFVVGNDLFNSDDLENRTTQGTPVTTDGRYYKTFGVVRRTIVRSIDRLRLLAPVKVILVPGNHDHKSVWHLGESLECWFNKYTDVEIDNTPRIRKYFEFGKVLLGLTHGHKGKRQDYPLLMATEQAEAFGRTKYREIHTGHNHRTEVVEHKGVRVRVISSLVPPDDWHYENGFVQNQRVSEAFIWNKDEGLIAQFFYNDDAYKQIVSKTEIA